MTVCGMNLSDGPVTGVAPRSGPLRLLVEGWRFRPHSYAMVNAHQCLAMLGRDDVSLWHSDAEMIAMLGTAPVVGLFGAEDEARLIGIPSPPKQATFDAVYRISYPYNLAPGVGKVFVFATCERMRVEREAWTGSDLPIGEAVEANDITIITPSEWSRQGFIRSGVSASRVFVVPHGVDTDTFRPMPDADRSAARSALGCGDRFVFLNVSALTGNKNVGAVVAAFAKVLRTHPRAMLVLKGLDSVYRSDQWLQVELAGIDAFDRWKACKNLSYVGAILSTGDLARIFQTADCYVSPYKSEGFNLPVLEATACGLPTVVPEGGCTDEFLAADSALRVPSVCADHDGDGSEWIKTNVDDIAAGMLRAMDEGVRARSLRAGPENATRFTWAAVTDRLLSVMAASLKGTE